MLAVGGQVAHSLAPMAEGGDVRDSSMSSCDEEHRRAQPMCTVADNEAPSWYEWS